FLTRDGKVIDEYITTIPVRKVGLERWLYNLAHENAFLYGLMSISIAIAAGWGASAIFTLLRR
ncbi:MAG: TIGR02186 family protein, partial [Paracoccaceae bacterium]|nr:TIGR02186 family protein [Paracoccaceae bacterium]